MRIRSLTFWLLTFIISGFPAFYATRTYWNEPCFVQFTTRTSNTSTTAMSDATCLHVMPFVMLLKLVI